MVFGTEKGEQMIDVKNVRDVRAEKQNEWAAAQIERQEATIEYIAMMADIDLEGEGEANELVSED